MGLFELSPPGSSLGRLTLAEAKMSGRKQMRCLPSLLIPILPALFFCLGCSSPTPEPSPEPASAPSRIVSTAPSITEILYTLGLGDRVVGVSRFCEYPPQAKEKTNVGGFLDPNLEVLVGLKPDLVILLDSAGPLRDGIEKLDMAHLTVKNRTVDDILESFHLIGRRCGVEDKAEDLIQQLNARIKRVAERTKGSRRPRVLFVVSRLLDSGDIRDVYVAANDGYFSRLIELAGGKKCVSVGAGDLSGRFGRGVTEDRSRHHHGRVVRRGFLGYNRLRGRLEVSGDAKGREDRPSLLSPRRLRPNSRPAFRRITRTDGRVDHRFRAVSSFSLRTSQWLRSGVVLRTIFSVGGGTGEAMK